VASQAPDQRGATLCPALVFDRLEQRKQRLALAEMFDTPGTQHARRLFGDFGQKHLNQGRLADPGLARQEHELPRTLQRRPPQRVQASKE
jgi:hypothetical protein